MKQIKLVVGDWSFDGHEKSENFIVEIANHTNLKECYTKGTELLGVNFIQKFCTGYEDSYISSEFWELLKSKIKLPERVIKVVENEDYYHNENFEDSDGYENEDEELPNHCGLETTTVTLIYLEICKLGGLEDYRLVEVETIVIGGYGLF